MTQDSRQPEQATDDRMHARRTTMADGRYLIYYTFDDAPAPSPSDASENIGKREPDAVPESTEERRV